MDLRFRDTAGLQPEVRGTRAEEHGAGNRGASARRYVAFRGFGRLAKLR
jgi:hypothetical protein